MTTNPVLTFRAFQSQPEFWNPKVVALGDDFEPEARAEALLKLVATYAAEKVRPVYERTNGADGYALGQLNPTRAGDAEGMLAQARRVHSWAENIAVKLPATAAGIEAVSYTHLSTRATTDSALSDRTTPMVRVAPVRRLQATWFWL